MTVKDPARQTGYRYRVSPNPRASSIRRTPCFSPLQTVLKLPKVLSHKSNFRSYLSDLPDRRGEHAPAAFIHSYQREGVW